MADPIDLTFGEVGEQHLGMHLLAVLPGAPRADVVLAGIHPCRGPEYVSLRGDTAPLGIPIKVSVTRTRDTPLRLYPDPIPQEEPHG